MIHKKLKKDILFGTDNMYILASRQAGSTTIINQCSEAYKALNPDKNVVIYNRLSSIKFDLTYEDNKRIYIIFIDTDVKITKKDYEIFNGLHNCRVIYFSTGAKLSESDSNAFIDIFLNNKIIKLDYIDNPYADLEYIKRIHNNLSLVEFEMEFKANMIDDRMSHKIRI